MRSQYSVSRSILFVFIICCFIIVLNVTLNKASCCFDVKFTIILYYKLQHLTVKNFTIL